MAEEDSAAADALSGRKLPFSALPVPIRHQPTGYHCGPTSLSAILAYWQVATMTPEAVGERVGTTTNGTEPWKLRKGAQGFNLDATIHGKFSANLDPAMRTELGEMPTETTVDDLRKALCSGRYASASCSPQTVIMDLQAWDEPTADYTNLWEDGHYVVLVGIDDTDDGNVYVMDPYLTESDTDKAYARFSISDPKNGLLARWHNYLGTAVPGQLPTEPQRIQHVAIFIGKGTAGHAVTKFENGATARSQRVLKMD